MVVVATTPLSLALFAAAMLAPRCVDARPPPPPPPSPPNNGTEGPHNGAERPPNNGTQTVCFTIGIDCRATISGMAGRYTGLGAQILVWDNHKLTNVIDRRLREFRDCTGADLTFQKVQGSNDARLQEELGIDAGRVLESGEWWEGNHAYTGYILRAVWLGRYYRGLQPIHGRITADNAWIDVMPAVRDNLVVYDGDTKLVPLDADYAAVVVREDLLMRHEAELLPLLGRTSLFGASGEPLVPSTLEEMAAISEFFHGRDLNGDGLADFGTCLQPASKLNGYRFFWALLAPLVQTEGQPGVFFDVKSGRSFFGTGAFRAALDVYRRLSLSSDLLDTGGPGSQCRCSGFDDIFKFAHGNQFKAGRCAQTYSYPGTINSMVRDDAGAYPTAVEGQAWSLAQNMSRPAAWGGGRAQPRRLRMPPGSQEVWQCEGGRMVPCDSSAAGCSEGGVNRSPFWMTGGWGAAISSREGNTSRGQLVWDFYTYLSSPEISNEDAVAGTWLDPSRLSSVSEANEPLFLNNSWSETAAADLRHTLTYAGGGNSNPSMDLRILGEAEYQASFRDELAWWQRETVAVRERPQSSLDAELVGRLEAAWAEVSDRYGGRYEQLRRYRASLGLAPPSGELRCQHFFEELTADERCSLCEEGCPDGESSTGFVVAMSALGVVLLACASYGVLVAVRRARKMLGAQRELQALRRARLEQAVAMTKRLNYPMNLVRGEDFLAAGRLVQHEELRDQGKLVVIDVLEEVYTYVIDYPMVFFSHQWTAFGRPDHTNGQYELMCTSLRAICEAKDWPPERVVVWVDFSCIPQRHRGLQALAIQSLTAYASAACAFVVVAPAIQHENIEGQVCDGDTYRTRMWCRAEQLCHSLRNGVTNMWVADGAGACSPIEKDWFKDAMFVFDGEATCCRLGHPDQQQCDRETLVLPILGLYGELYAGKEHGPEQQQIWQDVKAQKDVMFPAEFTFVSENGGRERRQRRELFGDMVRGMEELIDTSDNMGASMRNSLGHSELLKSMSGISGMTSHFSV